MAEGSVRCRLPGVGWVAPLVRDEAIRRGLLQLQDGEVGSRPCLGASRWLAGLPVSSAPEPFGNNFMQVTCPNCGRELNLPDLAAGQQVECPACHTAPQTTAEVRAAPRPPPSLQVSSQPLPPPPIPDAGAAPRPSGEAPAYDDRENSLYRRSPDNPHVQRLLAHGAFRLLMCGIV